MEPTVRRDDAEPLYAQIERLVADEIASGRLRAGERLPAERDLCARLGVSRVTLRRALSGLVAHGVLSASAGRGWFVAAGVVSEPPNELVSFTRLAASRGLAASARVLAHESRPADLEEADALGIAPGAEILDVRRLRLLEGVPVSVDRNRVPLALAPALAQADLATASLYELLESEHGIAPTRADYVVEARAAEADDAALLGLRAGDPVLVAHQTTYDQHGRAIEIGEIIYRHDRYRFRATLIRHGALAVARAAER